MPQAPWVIGVVGPVFAIDLWSGVGEAIKAMLVLGMHAYGVALETNLDCTVASANNLQCLVHAGGVERLSGECLAAFLERRRASYILVGGTFCAKKTRLATVFVRAWSIPGHRKPSV